MTAAAPECDNCRTPMATARPRRESWSPSPRSTGARPPTSAVWRRRGSRWCARSAKQGKLTENELIERLPGVFATLASSEPYTERVVRRRPRPPGGRPVGRRLRRGGRGRRDPAPRRGVHGGRREPRGGGRLRGRAHVRAPARDPGEPPADGRGPVATEFRPGLWRATVGIVGLGRIGQAVARRCRGFEMRTPRLRAHARTTAFVREHGVELTSLEDLLRRADLVTLHCPATPENRHLLNRERLGPHEADRPRRQHRPGSR